jgi:hypothetical protein
MGVLNTFPQRAAASTAEAGISCRIGAAPGEGFQARIDFSFVASRFLV